MYKHVLGKLTSIKFHINSYTRSQSLYADVRTDRQTDRGNLTGTFFKFLITNASKVPSRSVNWQAYITRTAELVRIYNSGLKRFLRSGLYD